MKFNNNSEEFIIKFNAKEYTIPQGSFDINDDNLSYFLIVKAGEWKKDVRCIEDSLQKTVVTEVSTIKKIEEKPVEEVAAEQEKEKEDVKETKKETEKKEKIVKRKKEVEKKLKELENSL